MKVIFEFIKRIFGFKKIKLNPDRKIKLNPDIDKIMDEVTES